jgi:putative PIN family toxin of toxin-antitoxin system
MKKFVLDTDVIVSAMRSPRGASRALVEAAIRGRVVIVASQNLFTEYEAKCLMPEHWQAAGITRADVQNYLETLAQTVLPVNLGFIWRGFLRDRDDEMILDAAMNGGAEAIVTFNRKDFAKAPETFEVKIISPFEALRSIQNG